VELGARIGAELVGGIRKALFRRVSGGVLLRWCNPLHEIQSSSSLVILRTMVFQVVSTSTEKGLERRQAQTQYQQLKLAWMSTRPGFWWFS